MTRVWLLFFTLTLGVAFRLFNPHAMVIIPFAQEYPRVPEDVFFYHLFEHFGNIIVICILISTIYWPIERQHVGAYVAYLAIELVDVILYRLYYRGWFIQIVSWNEVKTGIFGLVTIYSQWKTR